MLRRGCFALAVAAALVALTGTPAGANPGQASFFQDDPRLVYGSDQGVAQTLDSLKALGVDRIRVNVEWQYVAPPSRSPVFNASDPATYGIGAWQRYDRIDTFAHARGIGLDFDVTGDPPAWARGSGCHARRPSTCKPSPSEFGKFVHAVGERYSGSYAPPLSLGATLPRVSFWSVWNEPNKRLSLTPQSDYVAGYGPREHPTAPRIYRALFDQAYASLRATGHGGDPILIGELAAHGWIGRVGRDVSLQPLSFIRALYCVDRRLRPLRGGGAGALGCPTSAGGFHAFARAHPGLFSATGFAIHPYALLDPPARRPTPGNRDAVPLSALARLPRTLNPIFVRYGRRRHGGVPAYITEYGYETNPPNPGVPFSPARQAVFLNQADYIAYRYPFVRSTAQFLLADRPERTSFQSGLEFVDGTPKPAFAAYRLPIWVPRARVRRGRRIEVFGLVRPAPDNKAQRAVVEFRPLRRGAFRALATVSLSRARNFLDRRLRPPRSGLVRIRWSGRDPVSGARETLYSRTVAVHVR